MLRTHTNWRGIVISIMSMLSYWLKMMRLSLYYEHVWIGEETDLVYVCWMTPVFRIVTPDLWTIWVHFKVEADDQTVKCVGLQNQSPPWGVYSNKDHQNNRLRFRGTLIYFISIKGSPRKGAGERESTSEDKNLIYMWKVLLERHEMMLLVPKK